MEENRSRSRISLRRALSTLALLVMGFHSGEGKIDIDGYNASQHWRFANDAAFIAGAHNLSGVARSSSNKWATLISPNAFLSADHWHPGKGKTITFYESNDPLGNFEVRTVLGGIQVADSDIWFGVLDAPLPDSYEPLPVLDLPIPDISAFLASDLFNLEVFLFGLSENNWSSVTNIAVGKNRIESWDEFYSDNLIQKAAVAIRNEPLDEAFIPHEAYLQTYDSGAPLLGVVGGELTIIGFNWAISNTDEMDYQPDPGLGLRNTSLFSYAGDHTQLIQSYVEAFSIQPTEGYMAWMNDVFPHSSDWSGNGPAGDSDGDGLINLLEYAFGLDPLDPASRTSLRSEVVFSEDSPYLKATFSLRADPDLGFSLHVKESPFADSTVVPLSFDGSLWSSGFPSILSLPSSIEGLHGVWQIHARASASLESNGRQFLMLGVILPEPY